MVKAKKDSFPRVYKADGSYHYPKDYDNILRKKGEFYFENWEITGSKEEEDGKKKFALIKWVKETFMEDLRRFCQELEAETGKCIHVRGQWDNADPHVERQLIAVIEELFGEHGWV